MIRCNIFTGNHIKKVGIQDHIDLISNLKDYGFIVSESNALLEDHINIIIEEFTDLNFVKYLHSFKELFPNSVLVLVMTEVPYKSEFNNNIYLNKHISTELSTVEKVFAQSIYGIRQIRNFVLFRNHAPTKKNNFVNKIFILLLKKFIFSLRRCARFVIPKSNRAFLRSLPSKSKVYLKSIFRYVYNNKIISKYLKKRRQRAHDIYVSEYMRKRGQALSSVINIFDVYIDFHPKISNKMFDIFNINSLTLLPRADFPVERFLRACPKKLVSTGAMTEYRGSCLKRLSKQVNDFDIVVSGFPSDDELLSLGSFTINIPQTASWPMSSPVRIARSLKAGLVPIVLKKFYDHPIENCSLELQELLRREGKQCKELANVVASNVINYNKIAQLSFQAIAEELNSFKPFEATDHHVVWPNYQVDAPPILVEAYKGFNLVKWREQFWAISQASGSVDLELSTHTEADYRKSSTLEKLRKKIDYHLNDIE